MFEGRHYLTVNEAAEYIGCSRKTIRRRIADGTISAYTFGNARDRRLIRIKKSALDRALRPIPSYQFGTDMSVGGGA